MPYFLEGSSFKIYSKTITMLLMNKKIRLTTSRDSRIEEKPKQDAIKFIWEVELECTRETIFTTTHRTTPETALIAARTRCPLTYKIFCYLKSDQC